MRIALITTVKNEADILRLNLEYHSHIGVERFYVFLDNSTDNTRYTIEDLEGVSIRDSIRLEEVGAEMRSKEELQYVFDQLSEHHCARQMLNAQCALEMARSDGFDWLISLDADELICTNLEVMAKDALQGFLAKVPGQTVVVQFASLEAAQRRISYEQHVVREETIFQSLFYRDGDAIKSVEEPHLRKILDPIDGDIKERRGYLGHFLGKSAVRLSAEVYPKSVHFWRGPGGANVQSMKTGWLLHYNMCGYDRFIQKYRNFQHLPDRWVNGADIGWFNRAWRDYVNADDVSDEEMREYYQRWVLIRDEAIQADMTRAKTPPTGFNKLLRMMKYGRQRGSQPAPPVFVEVPAVRNFFAPDGS